MLPAHISFLFCLSYALQILSANNSGSFTVEVETDDVSVRTHFQDLENPGS